VNETSITLPVTANQEAALCRRVLEQERGLASTQLPLSVAIRTDGRLSRDQAKAAVLAVVRRHAALRARFARDPKVSRSIWAVAYARFAETGILSRPLHCQWIAGEGECDSIESENPERQFDSYEEIGNYVDGEASRTFGCYADSAPVRVLLLDCSDGGSVLVMVVDHLVSDAASMDIIAEELAVSLRATVAGEPRAVPPSDTSYVEHALWEYGAREASDVFRNQSIYWAGVWASFAEHRVSFESLRGGGRPEPGESSQYDFGRIVRTLDQEASRRVRAAAVSHHCSVFMVAAAATALCFAEVEGKRQIGLWTHYSNRRDVRFRRTVAFLANSHLCGVEVPEGSIGSYLSGVRRSIFAGAGHAEMPLHHLWWSRRCYPAVTDARVCVEYHQFGRKTPGTGEGVYRLRLPSRKVSAFGAFTIDVHEKQDGLALRGTYLRTGVTSDRAERLLSMCESTLLELSHAEPGHVLPRQIRAATLARPSILKAAMLCGTTRLSGHV
jgi:hypothetical protein